MLSIFPLSLISAKLYCALHKNVIYIGEFFQISLRKCSSLYFIRNRERMNIYICMYKRLQERFHVSEQIIIVVICDNDFILNNLWIKSYLLKIIVSIILRRERVRQGKSEMIWDDNIVIRILYLSIAWMLQINAESFVAFMCRRESWAERSIYLYPVRIAIHILYTVH